MELLLAWHIENARSKAPRLSGEKWSPFVTKSHRKSKPWKHSTQRGGHLMIGSWIIGMLLRSVGNCTRDPRVPICQVGRTLFRIPPGARSISSRSAEGGE